MFADVEIKTLNSEWFASLLEMSFRNGYAGYESKNNPIH